MKPEQLKMFIDTVATVGKIDAPDGWFNSLEGKVLYSIAKITPGPILEIGSYVGRSTTYIALGVKESQPKDFYTVDLHCATMKALKAYFTPLGFPDLNKGYKKYIDAGGTLAALHDNLSRRGLLPYVKILTGDFTVSAPKLAYSMVFADVTHNLPEIDRNVPHIAKMVSPGSVVAFHDIIADRFEDGVKRHLPLSYSIRYRRTLFGIVQ